MVLEKILNKTKKMKKLTANLSAMLITCGLIASSSGCSKKCGECPSGQYLVVDNPKSNQCYCCPDGTEYDSNTKTCKY